MSAAAAEMASMEPWALTPPGPRSASEYVRREPFSTAEDVAAALGCSKQAASQALLKAARRGELTRKWHSRTREYVYAAIDAAPASEARS